MSRIHTPPLLLIVDDDPEWREAVSAILCPPYAACMADCGDDGIRLARERQPKAIVLDVMLTGGMDGFAVLCHLRKDPLTAAIPVVMLSGVNASADVAFDPEESKRYLGVAPSAFLEKPVEPSRLREVVDGLVGRPAD